MLASSKRVKQDFAKIIDNVIFSAYNDASPVAKDISEIVIGKLVIEKSGRVFNIIERESGNVLFSDIYLIEAAFLITKYMQLGQRSLVKQVSDLEQSYTKHYLDMKCYTNSYQYASHMNDYRKMEILETRYRLSRSLAHTSRSDLDSMCKRITRKR